MVSDNAVKAEVLLKSIYFGQIKIDYAVGIIYNIFSDAPPYCEVLTTTKSEQLDDFAMMNLVATIKATTIYADCQSECLHELPNMEYKGYSFEMNRDKPPGIYTLKFQYKGK